MSRLRILLLALVVAAAATGCNLAAAPPAPRPSGPEAAASPLPSPSVAPAPAFSATSALDHVRVLAGSIGRRPSGSPADARAAAYIGDAFEDAGYSVTIQPFTRVDGRRSQNVIARLPRVDYTSGYLLVGAHHDTVPRSPGANDNASGVGVMLAVAEAVATLGLPVEFVAFGGEEHFPATRRMLEGSTAYLASKRDLRVIEAMLSIDMVGNGESVIILKREDTDPSMQLELQDVALREGISHRLEDAADISDHATFATAGIPSAHLWSGEHPTLHRPSDTIEVVEPDSLDRTGRLTLAWLRSRASPDA